MLLGRFPDAKTADREILRALIEAGLRDGSLYSTCPECNEILTSANMRRHYQAVHNQVPPDVVLARVNEAKRLTRAKRKAEAQGGARATTEGPEGEIGATSKKSRPTMHKSSAPGMDEDEEEPNAVAETRALLQKAVTAEAIRAAFSKLNFAPTPPKAPRVLSEFIDFLVGVRGLKESSTKQYVLPAERFFRFASDFVQGQTKHHKRYPRSHRIHDEHLVRYYADELVCSTVIHTEFLRLVSEHLSAKTAIKYYTAVMHLLHWRRYAWAMESPSHPQGRRVSPGSPFITMMGVNTSLQILEQHSRGLQKKVVQPVVADEDMQITLGEDESRVIVEYCRANIPKPDLSWSHRREWMVLWLAVREHTYRPGFYATLTHEAVEGLRVALKMFEEAASAEEECAEEECAGESESSPSPAAPPISSSSSAPTPEERAESFAALCSTRDTVQRVTLPGGAVCPYVRVDTKRGLFFLHAYEHKTSEKHGVQVAAWGADTARLVVEFSDLTAAQNKEYAANETDLLGARYLSNHIKAPWTHIHSKHPLPIPPGKINFTRLRHSIATRGHNDALLADSTEEVTRAGLASAQAHTRKVHNSSYVAEDPYLASSRSKAEYYAWE